MRVSILLLFLAGSPQDSATSPGLVGEYFEGISGFASPQKKPFYVRIEKKIEYRATNGPFHGTKLSDNFYARFTGLVRIAKGGTYTFLTSSDDGSRLFIDGKQVLDNGGTHPMRIKSGTIDLTPGDHDLKLEYFEGGGDAGLQLWWQPPGGRRQSIPPSALFHRTKDANIAWDAAAWNKRKKPRGGGRRGTGAYSLTNYGSLYSGTIDAGFPGPKSFANKGMAIRLDTETNASLLFDTELLTVRTAWTEGFVGYPAGRDGLEGQPFADGPSLFGTRPESLGWAKDGSFNDPRPVPFKPLPRDWARYKGLYRHGDTIVFTYEVTGRRVSERPAYVDGIFTRTFNVAPSPKPLRMLVCEADGPEAAPPGSSLAVLGYGNDRVAAALPGTSPGTALAVKDSRIELSIPASSTALRFTLAVWGGPASELSAIASKIKSLPAAEDLTRYTKGGPARWAETVTVAGTLGKDPGGYVVDTIPVPYENPYKSYMRLTGVDFFSDGTRAAVTTMDGDVWIVSGIGASLEKIVWKRYAAGLFQTLGLRIVDDVVYTLGRDQITRLHDLNGDGEADFYECFNNDCGVTPAYHEFTHDLHTDRAGNFYYAKGSNLGNARVPEHGSVVRVSKDGSASERWASGFRAPNGMSVGPDGTVTTSDNQGNWIPATPINYITKKGQFCGFLPCHHLPEKPASGRAPLCWIPHSVDNSGGGQVWVTSDTWGPFKGDLLHLSYGKCLLFKVLKEQKGDQVQGGVFKFPFRFVSGVMRGRFNPVDGQLYVVGMRGWQTSAPKHGAFQRVRYTGKPVNFPKSIKTTAKGFEITFTDPLDPGAADPDRFAAHWFNYKWTGGYGSPEFLVSDPDTRGREPLPITGAKLSADGKTLTLEIAGLKPVNQVVLRYRVKAADGTRLDHEIDYTINWQP